MKRLKIVCVLAVLGFLVITSNVMAVPMFTVEGFVNPYIGTVTDNLDGTTTFSQVDYMFKVTDAKEGAKMNFLSLEFLDEVFNDRGSLLAYDPSDWITPNPPGSVGTDGFKQFSVAGTPINKDETLTISMMNMILYNEALNDASFWQEDQIWTQSWDAMDTNSLVTLNLGTFSIQVPASDGGSTAPVPEPGTFLLLGSGLAGVVLYVRRKNCLINI